MKQLLVLLVVGALLAAAIGNADWGGAPASSKPVGNCNPNYAGACLDPHASDYDCAGGLGNGPGYTGTVEVVGADPYGLDADGDGTGCEPY